MSPAITFKLYPRRRRGFYRLYARVQIDGAPEFASLAIHVLP
jgi:hypothetical protein